MMYHVKSTLNRDGQFFCESTSNRYTLEAANARICDITDTFLFQRDINEATFSRQLYREFTCPERVVSRICYQFTGSDHRWELTYYVAPCAAPLSCDDCNLS